MQSAIPCTSAHVQVLSSYQDPISTSPYLRCAKCKILDICTRARIKFLSRPNFFITPYMQITSAKSCIYAHVQVPRYYQDLILRSYFYITSYLQGAKCKILHICTRASIRFLSRHNFFITTHMQGAKWKILHICKYQDLIKILFLHHLLPARYKVQDLAH